MGCDSVRRAERDPLQGPFVNFLGLLREVYHRTVSVDPQFFVAGPN